MARTLFSFAVCPLLLGLVASLAGCGKAAPARFRANRLPMAANEVPPARQQEIATILQAMFGTPDEPFCLPETGLDLRKIRIAAGRVWNDRPRAKHGLYRRHCAHCHGVTGDGAGPTALFLNPYPRDYRPAIFKFKSTERAALPTIDDLGRVLRQGIPGTAMPSFKLLPADEINALVEYVKYLSMRGQMELTLIRYWFDEVEENESIPATREVLVDELLSTVTEPWSTAAEQLVVPDAGSTPLVDEDRADDDLLASIEKGYQLFHDKRANCMECHGTGALGDGRPVNYDDWNKARKDFEDSREGADVRQFGGLPVRAVRPRNLRLGVYRGGRRPLDLFRRVHEGIRGTPMPASKGTLSPEEMWNIVDYVRALPHEQASRVRTTEPSIKRARM